MKLRKVKALTMYSLHGKTPALVILKIFMSINEI